MSLLLLFCVYLCAYGHLLAQLGAAACQAPEREALLGLRIAAGPRYSRLFSSWRGTDCCEWHGIRCSNITNIASSTRSVIELKVDMALDEFEACAPLPGATLAQLPSLRVLELRRSCYSGALPVQLGALVNLQILAVVGNPELSLPLPPQLGSLLNLHHLDISENDNIGGSIPPQLGSLPRLQNLTLHQNGLQGTIPPELGSLHRTLVYLDLSLNSLNGSIPSSFTSLQSLLHLNLAINQLSAGSSWPVLGSLSHLHYLDISSNLQTFFNTGAVTAAPTWHCSWSSLRYFSCAGIALPSDSMPFCFSSLASSTIEFLDLSYTGLTDASLQNTSLYGSTFAKASNLKHLYLALNQLTGFSSWLLQLPALETLDISKNQLQGSIPTWIGQLKSLKALDASGNSLMGQIPTTIANLSSLQSLQLSHNSLTGPIKWDHPVNHLPSLQSIQLSDNMLMGELPAAFANFTELSYLDVARNNLSGSLPAFMGKMEYIDIYNNFFSGPLPASMGNWRSMAYGDLSRNNLSGSIPASIGNWTKLCYLDLSFNILTGCIPAELGHRTMAFTSTVIPPGDISFTCGFILSNNRLTCNIPSTLGNLHMLDTLDLSNNDLTGEIPLSFGNLSAPDLLKLDLSKNHLTGGIPPSFQNISFFILNLCCNALSGTVPPLSTSSLQHLYLNSNEFEGPLPVLEPINSVLSDLDLSQNKFNGTIPTYFCTFRELGIMSISLNGLVGTIPECLGNICEYVDMDLSSNALSGSLPLSLSNCTRLQGLKVGNNLLQGPIPTWIGSSLSSLYSLELRNNSFMGEIPQSLRNCSSLMLLDLSYNNLTGRLPMWIIGSDESSLHSLQVLILRNNRFGGALPDQFMNSKILILDMADNYLQGSIPRSVGTNLQAMQLAVGELENFFFSMIYNDRVTIESKGRQVYLDHVLISIYSVLDLSGNLLEGEIPEELGKLAGLQVLDLSHNKLSGGIPGAMGNMSALESLDLSSNGLTGEIPTSLLALTFLASLDVSSNQLHGPIPQGHQFATFDNGSYAGNPGLCGPPLSISCSATNIVNSTNSTSNHFRAFWAKMQDHVSLEGLLIGFFEGFLPIALFMNYDLLPRSVKFWSY